MEDLWLTRRFCGSDTCFWTTDVKIASGLPVLVIGRFSTKGIDEPKVSLYLRSQGLYVYWPPRIVEIDPGRYRGRISAIFLC
jgi:hypothetical protein